MGGVKDIVTPLFNFPNIADAIDLKKNMHNNKFRGIIYSSSLELIELSFALFQERDS